MLNKTILLFSDLEGTIIGEETGTYDETQMKKFLTELVMLQTVTGAEIKIHLVSPVYRKDMERVLKQIDRSIVKFNSNDYSKKSSDTNLLLSEIQGAAAYPDEPVNNFFMDVFERHSSDYRITDLKILNGKNDFLAGAVGKEAYIRLWVETTKRNDNLLFCIFMGNGNNDLYAINYLINQGNSLIISPANSVKEVKDKSFFSSNKNDLEGVTEGIITIREEIERRIASKKQEISANKTKPVKDDTGDEPR